MHSASSLDSSGELLQFCKMHQAFVLIALFARSMAQPLRAGPSATGMADEASAWDSAPRAAPGGMSASLFLILVPAVLLFSMYCAKKEGGLYPNFWACFVVMVLFVYTMILSEKSYDCIQQLDYYMEVFGNYTKK